MSAIKELLCLTMYAVRGMNDCTFPEKATLSHKLLK